MTKGQYERVTTWQYETFAKSTALSKVKHLAEELDELKFDLINNRPEKRLEFADCFILLMGAAKLDGMTYEDICQAIEDKMEINLKRKWQKPDENGVVRHEKNGDE